MTKFEIDLDTLNGEQKKQLFNLLHNSNTEVAKPQYKDKYYHISTDGVVLQDTWNDMEYDKNVFTLGNCFKTRKKASDAIECLKVTAELKRLSIEAGEDKNPWYNSGNTHWSISLDKYGKVTTIGNFFHTANCIYFPTREAAENAIMTVGRDRIKRYLFGIE